MAIRWLLPYAFLATLAVGLAPACVFSVADIRATGSGTTGGGSTSSGGTGGSNQANGSSCTTAAECLSGFCVDGVCCNSACAGACHACSAALTGGVDGTCASATNGAQDPRMLCATQGASTCGNDGKCQAGACENWDATTVCVNAGCVNGSSTTLGTCDGNGACLGSVTTSCGAYNCKNGTTCATSCASSADCITPNTCKGGACVGNGATGSGCNASLGGADCTSGVCGANGICCAAACADQGATSCGTSGTCAPGSGACQNYPPNTPCASASCSAGTQTQAKACDGAGHCNVGGATMPCGPYACGAQSCLSSCTSDAQCVSGDYCAGGACVAKQANGATCTAPDQCTSGFCAGGFCCNTACTGAGNFCWLGTCVTLTAVNAGQDHTCALTSAGGVQCWGLNMNGQLGNNSKTDSPVPVGVSGLTTGTTQVSGSGAATCALSGGSVQCWGANGWGQFGNNSTNSSVVPVPTGVSGVAKLSSGAYHVCALTTGNGVECWGFDDDGQLGNNSCCMWSLLPVAVSGLSSGVAAIAAGGFHACALTMSGGVQCWGLNSSGELGNGSAIDSHVPVPVVGLSSGVAAIASGYNHTCAVTTGGGALCWGNNTTGALGNSSAPMFMSTPVGVTGLSSGVASLAAGSGHTCALTTAGAVLCWGDNSNGQLGNGTTNQSPAPVPVMQLSSGVAAITAGDHHTCALMTAGTVQCWGLNMNGQLGNNSTTESHVPVPVAEP